MQTITEYMLFIGHRQNTFMNTICQSRYSSWIKITNAYGTLHDTHIRFSIIFFAKVNNRIFHQKVFHKRVNIVSINSHCSDFTGVCVCVCSCLRLQRALHWDGKVFPSTVCVCVCLCTRKIFLLIYFSLFSV